MNKKDIKIGDVLFWNTTGAFNSKISLECKVIDIGKWIWVLANGNLSYNNLLPSQLTKEPLFMVTNKFNVEGVDNLC